ncbi:copper chaperone PCu(A)C [Marinobacterium marinum]|uniref:Copper chaperone PCu(A)C n=1 Tax=Marinobacterium marinum TaxID=2756129 RepID=A0A7W1WVW3_9GAMM|nr:copper chaperone PCu(A)C [Marinobacterium marinum]MBA4501184.1 copper chaperone PCu(A)C [Marinobacterium marinum]
MKKTLSLIATGLLFSSVILAAEVDVNAPYVRATAPGQPNSAAFMQLGNKGDVTRLVGASSPAAQVVELHTHTHDQGVMRMRKIDFIELPSRSQVELAPGGLHIMLIGLEAPLQAGSHIDLTLKFDDGSSEQLSVPVQMVMPAGMQHGQPAPQGKH